MGIKPGHYNEQPTTTDFGFEQVPLQDKQKKVGEVFATVADQYDLMNDLMSMGIHRYWKSEAIKKLQIQEQHQVLDLAGGSGDLSVLIADKLKGKGQVILADINEAMLTVGREKKTNLGYDGLVHFVASDAEQLSFPDQSFDRVIVAFGVRNMTDKKKALSEMYRVLKKQGLLLVLEFSKVQNECLAKVYDWYSFTILPKLGRWVVGDETGYRYLAESIRRHPSQTELLNLMQECGFSDCSYENYLNGIVAMHWGTK